MITNMAAADAASTATTTAIILFCLLVFQISPKHIPFSSSPL